MDNNVYRTEAYGITMDINKGNERKRLPVRDFYTFEVCMSDFVTDMCWWYAIVTGKRFQIGRAHV